MAVQMITGALVSKFVEMTIDNLASRFGDIFRREKGKKKQLSNLKVKLLSVDVVADDAEQKQFTNPRVRDWLLRAKDVVLDAEDLLNEIDYELSKAESRSTAKKVWDSFISSFVSFFNKEIESRMEKLIEDLEDLATESHVLGLKKADDVVVGSGLGSKLSSTDLANEDVMYGRDDDKKFVFNWLTSDTDNKLSILSIVGMPGLGKTSLVQHVFNDPRMDEAKFDVKAWVCISDEFDVFKVSRAILEHFTESTDDSRDTEMVHIKLKEKLTGKKFLLILDDVWNENHSKWEEVQKPLLFGAQGSRILVTTRNKEVASTMRSEEHSLELLTEDHSWKLFAKHALRDDDTQPNLEFREIGMKIVEKCKGLPLALKTMGSMLYNKSSVSEWEGVFQSEIWEFSKERCDIIPALALSYIHLPSHLKICFAYCSLFPKDYWFKKECLIQLWMTESFLHCPQHSKNPEDVCQQYLNDLLSRSFFQQSGKKEEVFVMHDLLHDLATYVGGDIYFRCEVDKREKIEKLTRHFSFELGEDQYFDEFGTVCNTRRLRTFMPEDDWCIKLSIHELLSKFKFLSILSLSRCSDLQELPDSVGNLVHLRSLDLSHTAIKKLTEKICSLSHLQILKLNYCEKLKELPSNLHLLTNLCRLEFIKTKVRKMPPHLGKLKNLRVVMKSFKVGPGRELGIQQLGELNLVGSLSIEELQNIENSLDALEADLKNKTLLVELQLQWNSIDSDSIDSDSKKEEEVLENMQPSKNLKKLSICNYGGKQFPNWLLENSLWNMVSLVLNECESCQRLPPLGLLPFLKKLKISGFGAIVKIDVDFHGSNSSSFKSLEKLVFYQMSEWEKWECEAVTGAFPRLRYLSMINCPKLKGHLPEFVALKYLEVSHCKQLEIVGSDTLKGLEINDCVSVRTFPLDLFPTLRRLYLDELDNLQMISQVQAHNHLEDLEIIKCPKLESLPGNMHMLLPSITCIFIGECPRLVGSLKGVFGESSSLKELRITELDAECFPDEGLLPVSLTYLQISHCPNLQKLDYKGLYQLSSLQTLILWDCPNLQRLPEEGLPKSISYFQIFNCPLLKQRCQKEGGEDGEKIAHIQRLYIG